LRHIESRLTVLEKKIEELTPRKKDGWDIASIIASIVTPILTFALGFWVISLANLGLERQRLQVSNVSQMQALISELRSAQTTSDAAEASALALAAFGPGAITPLLNLIQGGEPNVVIAAQAGLRAIGMSDPDLMCDRLVRVIRSRSQLYSWFNHRAALRLIGDLSCPGAAQPLEAYSNLLRHSADSAGLKEFARFVREQPAPTLESIDLLASECSRAINVVTFKESSR